MRQEVIRDFLNLPGIAGIALMDGRSRPYFYGLDQILNAQQEAALSQGILQVVGTIPEGFETFEFQFAKQQIYIYNLGHPLTLMVLAQGSLANPEYAKALQQLQICLQANIAHAVSWLRSVVDDLLEQDAAPIAPVPAAAPSPLIAPVPLSSAISPQAEPPSAPTPATPLAPTTLQDLLTILNQLSQFTTQYLGTPVVVNYLKSTRPDAEWASQFQVERTAQITCSSPSLADQPLNRAEYQLIQTWATAFVQRCTQTIRDFPSMVKKAALSNEQRSLLFKNLES